MHFAQDWVIVQFGVSFSGLCGTCEISSVFCLELSSLLEDMYSDPTGAHTKTSDADRSCDLARTHTKTHHVLRGVHKRPRREDRRTQEGKQDDDGGVHKRSRQITSAATGKWSPSANAAGAYRSRRVSCFIPKLTTTTRSRATIPPCSFIRPCSRDWPPHF